MKKIRLDLFLATQCPQYSRSYIKKLIEEGFVLVDGQLKKPSFILNGGEDIKIARRGPEIPEAKPEEIPLDILYEDDDLLVINKEAGRVVHPAPGHYSGTLVSAVLYHIRNSPQPPLILRGGTEVPPLRIRGGQEGLRPGIVHRLDKGTSGVMVIAKNEQSLRNLADQFKDRKVEKVYQALVFGSFRQKKGTISFSIGRDTQHRRKFSSKSRRTREATTHFEVVKEYSGLTLLQLKPETGRTHQLRVHLSESHHPIVGDTVYGAKSFLSSIKDGILREKLNELTRPLLHAWRLSFAHPTRRERMSFEAPLPDDFSSMLEIL